MAFQPVKDYFMARSSGIVHAYIYIFVQFFLILFVTHDSTNST